MKQKDKHEKSINRKYEALSDLALSIYEARTGNAAKYFLNN